MARMYSVALVFSLVVVALGARVSMPGAPIDASEQEEGVQRALAFAINEYNKGTNDMFVSTISHVNSVRKQIVSGIKYLIDVDIARTTCKKSTLDAAKCAFHTEPNFVKTMNCKFEVYVIPWLRQTSLTANACK
ncbi:cystatin-like [Rhinophrynus dorsalis]